MIVAVVAVWMMEMVADTVIGVVAMRHRLMPATRAVDMSGVMTATGMTGSAAVGVLG